MNQSLLQTNKNVKSMVYTGKTGYNLFKYPANLEDARSHKNATRIGKLQIVKSNKDICPCCKVPKLAYRYAVCCNPTDFSSFSPTISIYFKFLKFMSKLTSLRFHNKFPYLWYWRISKAQSH